MALITCPECGKEVSDKGVACPHCGYPLAETQNPNMQKPQQVEVTSLNLGPKDPKKRRGILIGGAVAIVAIIVVILAVFVVKKNNAAAARSKYIDNLWLARSTMLSGGAKAESLCNLTKSVWYNTIYEKSDSKTDAYTKDSSGKFYDDFNMSLASLYSDTSTKTTVSEIEENQERVAEIMRALQNPTDEFKACYETIDSMYEAYQSFTGLAISPSGSLTTYSSNFSTYDSDFMKYYDKLDTQIPDN